MATKREMKDEALALAKTLGEHLDLQQLERMNAVSLIALLAELNAKAKTKTDPAGIVSVEESAGGTFVARTDDGRELSSDDGSQWTETQPQAQPNAETTASTVAAPLSDELPPVAPSTSAVAPVVRKARPVSPRPAPTPRFIPTRKFLRDSSARTPYVVAMGRTVTSTRGQLNGGDGVRERDFMPDVLQELITLGAVVKRNPTEGTGEPQ